MLQRARYATERPLLGLFLGITIARVLLRAEMRVLGAPVRAIDQESLLAMRAG